LNRITVFRYELKRLMFSREYLLLLAAVTAYSVSLLRGLVLYGVNYTAPFSLLTFSTYCYSLCPFFFVLLLVLCARQFKTSERGAEAIIKTTCMPFHIFRLVRYGAIACAYLFAMVFPFAACFLFYNLIINYTDFGILLLPGVLIVVPPSVFLFGASMLFGNRKPAAIYIMLVGVLVLSAFKIPLPDLMDIIGTAAVQALYEGHDHAFSAAFIAGRFVLMLVGFVSMIISLYKSKQHYT